MSCQATSIGRLSSHAPRVSIVVPVYNGAEHLRECLASITAQTYHQWEAVVVNNCSTDGTAEIAEEFAEQDPRFRLVHCTEFLSQSENYNRAIACATRGSEFVKIVEADNNIWPECIERMVEVASSDHEIGIVGCHYLHGRKLFGDGIRSRRNVLSGNEVRRDHLVNDEYYLGNPTTLLFRAAALSEATPCFRPGVFFDDVELCFRILGRWKFGVVHRVLAFVRDDNGGIMSRLWDFDFVPAQWYVLAVQFGQDMFRPPEAKQVIKRRKKAYLRCLAYGVVTGRTPEYWQFHRDVCRLAGKELSLGALVGPVAGVFIDALFNPKSSIKRVLRRWRRLHHTCRNAWASGFNS
jgi:glycosyltransferase involved in cell wall biosynthesis